MNASSLQNVLLGLDMIDSLIARFQNLAAGMKAAVAEGRDLTDAELQGFRDEAEAEDQRLRDEIERQRAIAGNSDKVTGDTGGDLRP